MDPADDVLVSAASPWEIQVKVRVGKPKADLRDVLAAVGDQGFDLLPVMLARLLALGPLPRHHGDPWDHLLVAQANAEEAVFMSEDHRAPHHPVTSDACSGSGSPRTGGMPPPVTSDPPFR